jgi:hypothetical protein
MTVGGTLRDLVPSVGDFGGEENVKAAYICLRSGVEKSLTSEAMVVDAASEGKDDDPSKGEK